MHRLMSWRTPRLCLEEIIVTLRADGTGPAAFQHLPDFLRGEIEELRESLACGSLDGGANT
jgi:hypothetical protein